MRLLDTERLRRPALETLCSANNSRLRKTCSIWPCAPRTMAGSGGRRFCTRTRSEEHTSELQSHLNLVCRLLLEKKKMATAPFMRKQPNKSLLADERHEQQT